MEFPTFRAWCQKVTPLVYDSSLSYYEILCKVISMLNDVVDGANGINTQITANTNEIEKLKDELKVINAEFIKIKNGGYASVYIAELEKWIDKYLLDYVARVAKFVVFGLTDDGYFIANIPETWDFLEFDTIVDPASPHYGCLVLTY